MADDKGIGSFVPPNVCELYQQIFCNCLILSDDIAIPAAKVLAACPAGPSALSL
jgi:hypothetical protein